MGRRGEVRRGSYDEFSIDGINMWYWNYTINIDRFDTCKMKSPLFTEMGNRSSWTNGRCDTKSIPVSLDEYQLLLSLSRLWRIIQPTIKISMKCHAWNVVYISKRWVLAIRKFLRKLHAPFTQNYRFPSLQSSSLVFISASTPPPPTTPPPQKKRHLNPNEQKTDALPIISTLYTAIFSI